MSKTFGRRILVSLIRFCDSVAGTGQRIRNRSISVMCDRSSIPYLATWVFLPHLSFPESNLVHFPEARRFAAEEFDVVVMSPTARCLRDSIWRDSLYNRDCFRAFPRWSLQAASSWKTSWKSAVRIEPLSGHVRYRYPVNILLRSFKDSPFHRGKFASFRIATARPEWYCLFDNDPSVVTSHLLFCIQALFLFLFLNILFPPFGNVSSRSLPLLQ